MGVAGLLGELFLEAFQIFKRFLYCVQRFESFFLFRFSIRANVYPTGFFLPSLERRDLNTSRWIVVLFWLRVVLGVLESLLVLEESLARFDDL